MNHYEYLMTRNEEEMAEEILWLLQNPMEMDERFCKQCKVDCPKEGCAFGEKDAILWWLKEEK